MRSKVSVHGSITTGLLCRMRIYQYYLPVYFWCCQQLELHRQEKGAGQPLILGMQAPQVLTTPCRSQIYLIPTSIPSSTAQHC